MNKNVFQCEVSKLPSNHLLFNFPEGISQRAQYSLNVLSFCPYPYPHCYFYNQISLPGAEKPCSVCSLTTVSTCSACAGSGMMQLISTCYHPQVKAKWIQ